jgi:hypothetical protein
MAIIPVTSPTSGLTYNVKIAGSAPTPEEQQKIAAFMAQKDASYAPEPVAQAEDQTPEGLNALQRGIALDPLSRGLNLQTSKRALADALGLGSIAEAGAAGEAEAEKRIAEFQKLNPNVTLDDVIKSKSVGGAASFAGQAAGQQASDIAIQVGATGAGAALGSMFFGVGAAPGAAVGLAVGVGATTLRSIPDFFGEAIRTQEEAGYKPNITRAAAATAGMALADAISDYLIVGKFIDPSEGKLVSRALKGGAEGVSVNGASEVVQAVINRAQANLPLDDEDAFKDYAENFAAAAVVGGGLGATGSAVGGKLAEGAKEKKKNDELDEDLAELGAYADQAKKFSEAAEVPQGQAQIGVDRPLALPAPDQAPTIDQQENVFVPEKPYTKGQYDRALQQVRADGSFKPGKVQAALRTKQNKVVPMSLVKAIQDDMLLADLQSYEGSAKAADLAASTTASEVKSLPARESLRRTSEALQSQIEQANNKLEELRLSERYAAQSERDLRGNKTTPQAVAKSIAAVESTIRDLSTNLSDVSTRIDTVDQDTSVPTFEKVGVPSGKALLPIADVPVEQTAQVVQALEPQIQAQNLALESNKNELKNVGFQIRKILTAAKKAPLNNMQQDRLSKLQKRQSNLKALVLDAESKPRTAEAVIANARSEAARKAQEDADRAKRLADMQAAADARAAADGVERLAAAAKTNRPENPTPFSTEFTNAQVAVLSALRKRLNNLNLQDIKLAGERVVGDGGGIAEGAFDSDAGQRIITLSMAIYDPSLTQQQLFDRIAEVMNHEVIHALRSLGVLTNAELKVLAKAAANTNYMAKKGRNVVARSYTYLDRAKRLYPDLDSKPKEGDVISQVEEEAIAEMFRDNASGRLNLAGRPKSLFKKIRSFITSLIRANVDNGFDSVDKIFGAIRSGEIGARDRAGAVRQDADTAYSKLESMKETESANELRAAARRAGDRRRFEEGRTIAALDGAPKNVGASGPDVRLVGIAEAYANRAGINYTRQGEYVKVDPEFAARVADAYENMPHAPQDPEVQAAYADLIKQTMDQYKALTDGGYQFYFFDESNDPYDGNPWNAMRDLRENQTMAVYATEAGYGSGSGDLDVADNPMLADTGLTWSYGTPDGPKKRVLANDLFRAVHDAFGHGLEGAGFRARGEENAWQAHVRLFTGDAVKAITSETRGQNSWLNYGPYGERNRNASLENTIFADQKTGLMPSFTWSELRSPDYSEEVQGDTRKLSRFTPNIPLAPAGVSSHKLPNILLTNGSGEPPANQVTQAFASSNIEKNNDNTLAVLRAHPTPLASVDAWKAAMQDALGGDYLPVPPLVAMKYANDVDAIVEKLNKLSPELLAGVDRGFKFVRDIQGMYRSGTATPEMTMQMFIWGILSRGAGPVQQESAYIDVINDAMPYVKSAISRPLTKNDIASWERNVSSVIPDGSPAKQVTMNVNAAGKLISEMSQVMPSSDQTVISKIHNMMVDQSVSASDIRRTFLTSTEAAGIDNKVLSFILLVSGRDDVLVMDRIQGRHLWDDGRYKGANIYDGVGKNKAGLNGIFKGPRGILITQMLENAIRPNIKDAYAKIGRPQDASLGRFHWETWVIDGEQVVDHSTLGAIFANNPIGGSVTEGKTDTFSSGMTYIKTKDSSVVKYPLSDGKSVYMTPLQFKEFLTFIKSDKNGIVPKGFKMTARADIPWFERADVNRNLLDVAAKEFENADSNGNILGRDEGTGKGDDALSTEQLIRESRDGVGQRKGELSGEPKETEVAPPVTGQDAIPFAQEEAKRQLSRLLSSTSINRQTPSVGPSDLMRHAENLRYAGVQEGMANIINKVAGVTPFKVDYAAIDDATTGFMTKLQDDMLPVGKMYDALRKQGFKIPQEYDAYFKEQLYQGNRAPKIKNFIDNVWKPALKTMTEIKVSEVQSNNLKTASPYYVEILKANKNPEHAASNAVLYALHAKERNALIRRMSKGADDRGSGMSDAEANAIIDWASKLDVQQKAKLNTVVQAVRKTVDMTNDVYIDGGLIPDYKNETIELADGTPAFDQYDNYVPLSGFAKDMGSEDVDSYGLGVYGAKHGSRGKPNKSPVGRISYSGDILANVQAQYESGVNKAEHNKVGQALLGLIESDVPTDGYAFLLERSKVKKAIVNGTIRYVPDKNINDPNAPILPVRRDGKEYLIQFHDPRIAAAMKGSMTAWQPGWVMSALHSLTRAYASLLTTYNPTYTVGNVPRDIETAIVNAQQFDMKGSAGAVMKGFAPAFKGILKTVRETGDGSTYWEKRYQQFYNAGGQNVLNQVGDAIKKSGDISKIINQINAADAKGARAKMKNLFVGSANSIAANVEAVNLSAENATRLAFFDAMVKQLESQGVPTQDAVDRAAFHAKNLTTNFSKGGEYKNALNTFYLFFNASLQGSMALMSAIVNSPAARKAVAGLVVMGFTQELVNGLLSGDDNDDGVKDYDTIGEYDKTHNIIFPDLTGTGTYVKIPLAYGLNTFYNGGRVLGNVLRGAMFDDKGTYTPSQAAASVVGTTTELINPFGGNNMWTFVFPTALDLPVELLTNKNFMDAPIYKELSPYDTSSRSNLYWSTTSPSAIWTAKAINDVIGGGTDEIPGTVLGNRIDIQPDVIEHIFGFLTGGTGAFINRSFDTITQTAPEAFKSGWEGEMTSTVPFLRKFVSVVGDRESSGDFYENRTKVLTISGALNKAKADGNAAEYRRILAKYPIESRVSGYIRKIDSALKKLNKQKRMIDANPRLSNESKRLAKERIEERVSQLIAVGNKVMADL